MERTELSEHIRILREDYLHETQSQFAERLGLSRIAVARYEAGRVPKRAVLRVLREIAADVDYRSGSVVFSRASGQQPPPAEPENSLLELMDTATRLAGNWSLVKAYVDMEEEYVRYWASSVEDEIKDLMVGLRKLSIGGTDVEAER